MAAVPAGVCAISADFPSGTLSASLLPEAQRGLGPAPGNGAAAHRCPTPMPLFPSLRCRRRLLRFGTASCTAARHLALPLHFSLAFLSACS